MKDVFTFIPENLRIEVLQKLRISNAQRIYIISVIGFFFAFLILGLDYIRYSNGKLLPGSLYFYLFLNHLGLFLFIFPIITIRMNREAFANGRYKYGRFFIYTWAIFLGVMFITLAILTFSARISLSIYFIYIIIANFGLLMVHLDRVLLNGLSFLAITAAILVLFFGEIEILIVTFLEALGVTVVSFVVSTQTFNAFLRQVVADKLLERKNAEIAEEKKRGDELLNIVLPEEIANELKATGHVQPRQFSSATIMMLDFKNFSNICRSLTPEGLIAVLDHCFKNFDRITATHRLEKIKTIGDAYLCVGGVPKSNQTHPFDCIEAALEMLAFLEEWKVEQMALNEPFFEARVGIHSGPVIAGVVGDKKFVFDMWGPAMNITARLESSGEAGKINISQTTYDLVKHKMVCSHRGKIPIKNQEPLDMYFVKGAVSRFTQPKLE